MLRQISIFLVLAVEAAAAPAVSSVVNAASNIGQAQPNGGIAQGAIFVAYGTGLGPTPIAISPTPFQGLSVLRPDRTVLGGTFVCYTHASAGKFTVPPYILLTLPTSDAVPGVKAQSSLTITATVAAPFIAAGMDAGAISSSIQVFATPVYK